MCCRCERSREHFYTCCMNVKSHLWGKNNNVFRIDLSQSPALCILGIIAEGVELSFQQTLWCRLALTTGCRIVLRHWKSKNVLPFNEWLGEMSKIEKAYLWKYGIHTWISYERVDWRSFVDDVCMSLVYARVFVSYIFLLMLFCSCHCSSSCMLLLWKRNKKWITKHTVCVLEAKQTCCMCFPALFPSVCRSARSPRLRRCPLQLAGIVTQTTTTKTRQLALETPTRRL